MALPAYDQCIKASHVFNLLDARGVISVTERQSYILRVRELAKACGEAWVATEAGGAVADGPREAAATPDPSPPQAGGGEKRHLTPDLLIERFSEEIPVRRLRTTCAATEAGGAVAAGTR